MRRGETAYTAYMKKLGIDAGNWEHAELAVEQNLMGQYRHLLEVAFEAAKPLVSAVAHGIAAASSREGTS